VTDIVIVNPRFDLSFWGMERCMGVLGKRANLPVACLSLLAGLVPRRHQVTLIDENIEAIDFERLGRADMVCLTGMSVQAQRLREILKEVRARGVLTVVGGAMATVEPEQLEDFADVIFVGEADVTWPQFLREWEEGRHRARYVQAELTDLTQLPLPRLELLKTQHYLFGSLQISRGCPFTCEFCDIIVTFGRKPRHKTSQQVLAELDSQLRAGLKVVLVVDDNLIGNKKAIKPILRDIAKWQQERGYPLILFTEASLDLAEDDELMELMGLAGFNSVFIGLESPNEASLKETKKLQNIRPKAGTMIERVHNVQAHGLDVWCGMIVGFDHDDDTVFKVMPDFLAEARLATAMIGLLHAIPTTPLYKRLKMEGRLNDKAETARLGTNVVPLGIDREELATRFAELTRTVYAADAYFDRLDALFLRDRFRFAMQRLSYWRGHRLVWAKTVAEHYVKFFVLAARLLRRVEDRGLRTKYCQQLLRVMRKRAFEPHVLFVYAVKTALHYHYAAITGAWGPTTEGLHAVPDGMRSFSTTSPVPKPT
jgi:radical SAM superfamily enzyme YgiQ (UPF0313 family)